MTTRRWSRKVQDCCLAIALCISSGICQGADPPVFSGPQPGEKLADLQVRGLFGELAGKEVNLLKEAGTRPTLFIFVHELTRPGNSLTQALMRYRQGYHVSLKDDMKDESIERDPRGREYY